MLIHREDEKRKGFYKCIHAVGPGVKEKLTTNWNKVTCRNCLKEVDINVYYSIYHRRGLKKLPLK